MFFSLFITNLVNINYLLHFSFSCSLFSYNNKVLSKLTTTSRRCLALNSGLIISTRMQCNGDTWSDKHLVQITCFAMEWCRNTNSLSYSVHVVTNCACVRVLLCVGLLCKDWRKMYTSGSDSKPLREVKETFTSLCAAYDMLKALNYALKYFTIVKSQRKRQFYY